MKLSGILLLTCVLAAGCGDDDSPSTPSTCRTRSPSPRRCCRRTSATPSRTPKQSGRGTATITFNLTRNTAGAIQSGTVDFHYDLTAFPAGTTITLSHIHTGASGVGGGGPDRYRPVRRDVARSAEWSRVVGNKGSRSPTRRRCSRSSTTRPASTSTCTRPRIPAASRAVSWSSSRRLTVFTLLGARFWVRVHVRVQSTGCAG